MEGLQDDTETCCDWWFGNGGPGSGRIEDAKIFTVTKTVRKEGKANISIQTSFVLFVVSFPLFSALLRVSSH